MAKNRNKKKNSGVAPMDASAAEPGALSNSPEAMDTTEIGVSALASNSVHRKVKGVQMKRTKSARKKKAILKAISRDEKTSAGVSRKENKKTRVKLAKTLYE